MRKMNFGNVCADIEQIKICFSGIILSTSIQKDNKIISWKNYKPGISNKMYSKEFEDLRDGNQYSFMLTNKALVQLYYDFNGDTLNKAKLAYYPYPIILKEADEEISDYFDTTDDQDLGEYYYDIYKLYEVKFGKKLEDKKLEEVREHFSETVGLDIDEYDFLLEAFNKKYELTNSSHIRIDYDPKVTSHHKAEIQYSSINNIRLPLEKLVSPFLFIDLIVRYEFPEYYLERQKLEKYKTGYNLAKQHSGNIQNFKEKNIFISHN